MVGQVVDSVEEVEQVLMKLGAARQEWVAESGKRNRRLVYRPYLAPEREISRHPCASLLTRYQYRSLPHIHFHHQLQVLAYEVVSHQP
jgi:hypothetical protein